jgi:hypothetical protein
MRRITLPFLFCFAFLTISSARLGAQSSANDVSTLDDAPAAAQQSPQGAPPASPPPAGGVFHPYVIFNVNANFNSKPLLPGSWAAFALPSAAAAKRAEQFQISPGNSVFGAGFTFGKVNETEINGKVDFDLRGTTPLQNQNEFEILFLNVYLELKNGTKRLVIGQTSDVVSPLIPSTLNLFPTSYTPGSLGFVRPMVRAEHTLSSTDTAGIVVQGAVAQAIETLAVGGEALATQSGWPDIQARAAYSRGTPNPMGQRPIEVGVWGHFGERRLTLLSGVDQFDNTYSFGFDGRFQFSPTTKFQGEYYTGQLVGQYLGAILQEFDRTSGTPVDGQGFWVEVEHAVRPNAIAHVRYGLDNVEETGLGLVGPRTQNANLYANLFYGFSSELSLAGEFAWWHTAYRGLPDASPIRFELSLIYKWIK